MYNIYSTDTFEKSLKKVKGKKQKDNIKNKMEEIARTVEYNPDHYKNLKKPLQKYKRVHINTNFVILFEIDSNKNKVIFSNYKHHDKIYK